MRIRTANTILYCKKWQETVAFYADVLNLNVHFSNEWFVEFEVNASARLSIANEDRASIKSAGGKGITIAFQIDGLQIAHTRLLESGANPTSIKDLWGSEVFYVYDPEGNRIEFWS